MGKASFVSTLIRKWVVADNDKFKAEKKQYTEMPLERRKRYSHETDRRMSQINFLTKI